MNKKIFLFLVIEIILVGMGMVSPTCPIDDTYINSNITLNGGLCNVDDANNDGVLIINASNIVLDCNGTTLITNLTNLYGRPDDSKCIYNSGFKNVTIKNCIIQGYEEPLTYRGNADNGKLLNNTLISNFYGIWVWSSNNLISGNNVTSGQCGIVTQASSYNVVSDNVIDSISAGGFIGVLYFYYGSHNTAINNVVISGTRHGIMLYRSNYDDVINNSVSSSFDSGIFLHTSGDNHISDNLLNSNGGDGIWLFQSSNNEIYNNTATSNGYYGTYIDTSSNNHICGNDFSLDLGGICLWKSNSCSIFQNTVNSNSEYGIYMGSSSNNILTDNTVSSNNQDGIRLYDSSSNTIYNNYFNNTKDINLSNSINTWNTTKTPEKNIVGGDYLGGNCWSDYAGVDANGDGIGDTPYIIDPDNIDYLPLVATIPSTTTTSTTTTTLPTECDLPGDYPPCGEISLSEVIDFINLWSQGQATPSDVVDLINAWAGG